MVCLGNKQIILFSELTDKSKAYAKRIKAKDTLLIFCNTEEGEKQQFDEDTSRNMIFTDQSELQLLKQLRKKKMTIMEMGEDEERNVQKTVEIIRFLYDECGISDEDAGEIYIYTVSGQPEAATIIDNIMRRGTKEEPLSLRQTLSMKKKGSPLNCSMNHRCMTLSKRTQVGLML